MPKHSKFKQGLKKLALTSGALMMAASMAGAQPSITTELNGSRVNFDQPPIMQDGRVLVPLRGIFENLGATVLYTPANKTIKATGDGNTVELTLGQRQAFVNGQQVYLDVPADTINGRTMVPLRFVSEAMGAEVKWSAASRTVAIERDAMNDDIVSDGNNSPQQPIATRPDITNLIHNARGTLRPGDQLTVTMTGEPGSQARFSILGAINDVTMREVSSGRYEGSLRITEGMNVNNGTLVGYLKKNNLETVKEAGYDVTIASTGNGNSNGTIALTPSPGSIVNQARPTLQAVFPEAIRSGTASFRLNGQDYQPSLNYDGRTVTLTPSYNLNPGTHRVEAQALTQDGRVMSQDWTFTVSQSASTGTGTGAVSVSNLTNGTTVPAVFNVQGQTSPYTKVRIDATAQRALIPGIIGINGGQMSTSTVSDANGRFNVQLNTSSMPANSQIDLEVSSLDANGTVTDRENLRLVRQ